MLWFECDNPDSEGVANPNNEIGIIRENMPPAMSCYHDTDGFTIIVWDTKTGTVETYVFDDGRPTTWYFSPKNTAVDAWWKKITSKGENTAVAARWICKHIERREVEEEGARLAYGFILCLEEMRGSDKGSPTWECARSDARDKLADLCDLAGVPVEEVIGSDI